MPRSLIVGTGHYAPERVVDNEVLAAQVNSDPEWIRSRTGIVQRHYAAADQTTSDLATIASRRALENAGCTAQDLDAIIFATLSPDVVFPGCGVYLQEALGVPGIPALDVRNQCSGYLYALSVADAWIRAGVYTRILVVGSEIHSAGLDFSPSGRDITVLFGDGAGAVVVQAEEDDSRGIMDVRLGADGSGAPSLWCEAPGSRHRPQIDVSLLRAGRQYPQMKGRAVFRHAVTVLTQELQALLHDHSLDPQDIVFVPHQANMRLNERLAQTMGLAPEQVIHTIDRFGNTTAASIPMALDSAFQDGRIVPGTPIIHAAFGSGFTWGTAYLVF